MEVPQGRWEVEDTDPTMLLMLSNEKEDAYIFVVCGEVPEADKPPSPREFALRKEASQAVIEKQFDTFTVVDRRNVIIGGRDAEEIEFVGTKGDDDFSGKVVFLSQDRKVFILSGSTTGENYARLVEEMDGILRSFTLT